MEVGVKKIAMVFVLMLFGPTSYGQSGWFWQNPLPQGNALEWVCFTDANSGWTVGDYGTILHTTDGGSTWNPQTSGSTNYL